MNQAIRPTDTCGARSGVGRRSLAHRILIGMLALLALGAPAQPSAVVAATGPALATSALAHAQSIRAELGVRYGLVPGRKLAVTEATSTGVVESFTLLTADLENARVVRADNGIYFAICPVRAVCPYPARRFARPAADLRVRRLALELALRTFLETTATVVAVSLPTPRFILVIFDREELAREVDLRALAKSLNGDPARPAVELQRVVDQVTRPRTFLPLGLEPTPSGRDAMTAMPLWSTTRSSRVIAAVGLRHTR